MSDTGKVLYKEGSEDYQQWQEATKRELLGRQDMHDEFVFCDINTDESVFIIFPLGRAWKPKIVKTCELNLNVTDGAHRRTIHSCNWRGASAQQQGVFAQNQSVHKFGK